jgi:hypothetical protein
MDRLVFGLICTLRLRARHCAAAVFSPELQADDIPSPVLAEGRQQQHEHKEQYVNSDQKQRFHTWSVA